MLVDPPIAMSNVIAFSNALRPDASRQDGGIILLIVPLGEIDDEMSGAQDRPVGAQPARHVERAHAVGAHVAERHRLDWIVEAPGRHSLTRKKNAPSLNGAVKVESAPPVGADPRHNLSR